MKGIGKSHSAASIKASTLFSVIREYQTAGFHSKEHTSFLCQPNTRRVNSSHLFMLFSTQDSPPQLNELP